MIYQTGDKYPDYLPTYLKKKVQISECDFLE